MWIRASTDRNTTATKFTHHCFNSRTIILSYSNHWNILTNNLNNFNRPIEMPVTDLKVRCTHWSMEECNLDRERLSNSIDESRKLIWGFSIVVYGPDHLKCLFYDYCGNGSWYFGPEFWLPVYEESKHCKRLTERLAASFNH